MNQVWQTLVKYSSTILAIGMGLIGKFSYDLVRNKKFTISYILGSTGLAVFGGYMAGLYLFDKYPNQAPLLVPMVTMLSNNFVSAIMVIDYKALVQKDWKGAFEILFKKP